MKFMIPHGRGRRGWILCKRQRHNQVCILFIKYEIMAAKWKQWPKVLDTFSESSGSYARDVEHNINAWCSIWEDSAKAKAYRAQWNEIYKMLAQGRNKE